ncbi:MAG: hypothetical protein DHS80DRAFT_29205 [Piptocephalis tieghemiana]|nr:MAG: hypothetical protein DHS80DRAFT_29205 [Piptocephalis tieghemiana]
MTSHILSLFLLIVILSSKTNSFQVYEAGCGWPQWHGQCNAMCTDQDAEGEAKCTSNNPYALSCICANGHNVTDRLIRQEGISLIAPLQVSTGESPGEPHLWEPATTPASILTGGSKVTISKNASPSYLAPKGSDGEGAREGDACTGMVQQCAPNGNGLLRCLGGSFHFQPCPQDQSCGESSHQVACG